MVSSPFAKSANQASNNVTASMSWEPWQSMASISRGCRRRCSARVSGTRNHDCHPCHQESEPKTMRIARSRVRTGSPNRAGMTWHCARTRGGRENIQNVSANRAVLTIQETRSKASPTHKPPHVLVGGCAPTWLLLPVSHVQTKLATRSHHRDFSTSEGKSKKPGW